LRVAGDVLVADDESQAATRALARERAEAVALTRRDGDVVTPFAELYAKRWSNHAGQSKRRAGVSARAGWGMGGGVP
jgi:hypothetical protein